MVLSSGFYFSLCPKWKEDGGHCYYPTRTCRILVATSLTQLSISKPKAFSNTSSVSYVIIDSKPIIKIAGPVIPIDMVDTTMEDLGNEENGAVTIPHMFGTIVEELEDEGDGEKEEDRESECYWGDVEDGDGEQEEDKAFIVTDMFNTAIENSKDGKIWKQLSKDQGMIARREPRYFFEMEEGEWFYPESGSSPMRKWCISEEEKYWSESKYFGVPHAITITAKRQLHSKSKGRVEGYGTSTVVKGESPPRSMITRTQSRAKGSLQSKETALGISSRNSRLYLTTVDTTKRQLKSRGRVGNHYASIRTKQKTPPRLLATKAQSRAQGSLRPKEMVSEYAISAHERLVVKNRTDKAISTPNLQKPASPSWLKPPLLKNEDVVEYAQAMLVYCDDLAELYPLSNEATPVIIAMRSYCDVILRAGTEDHEDNLRRCRMVQEKTHREKFENLVRGG